MSGAASVPLAALAIYFNNAPLKVLFACLAAFGVVVACYQVWRDSVSDLQAIIAERDAEIAAKEQELCSLRNPFSGAKWENFLFKLETLDALEKYVLYHFVLQGCHMLEDDGVEITKSKFHCVTSGLSSIQRKTGFITPGFNGYEANPGIVLFLEQWAKTYDTERR
jgi:hypothetical protein